MRKSSKFHNGGATGEFLVKNYPINKFSTIEPIPHKQYTDQFSSTSQNIWEHQKFGVFHFRGGTQKFLYPVE
jgi:hypothetical protein